MASNNIFQKAEDWLDDLETVGTYAAEKIGDVTKDMPIVKALGNIAANPTKQEIGSQVAYLASATNKGLQESFGGDPVDMALNYGPNAMGTIVGKSAAGWAKLPNKFSNMLDKMERAEISDISAKLKPIKLSEFNIGKVADYLDHPALYDQYPWLKDMDMSITIDPRLTDGGALQNTRVTDVGSGMGQDIKSINVKAKTPEKAREILVHEIQHAIQEQEGFARGGSPERAGMMGPEAKLKLEDIERKRQIFQDAMSTEADIYISRANDSPEYKKFIDDAWSEWSNKLGEKTDTNPYGVDLRTAVKYQLIEKDPSFKRLSETAEKLRGKAKLSPMDVYKRLGGEIESRSVASRSNIPQDQLKYSQPYAGENIPLKEWIKAEDFLDQ